jgi:hypothetical protein
MKLFLAWTTSPSAFDIFAVMLMTRFWSGDRCEGKGQVDGSFDGL